MALALAATACRPPALGRVGVDAIGALRYRVGVEAELETWTASVCFEGNPPRALIPGVAEGAELLERVWIRPADGRDADVVWGIASDGAVLDLRSARRGDCVIFEYDAAALASASARRAPPAHARFVRTGLWLWRPPSMPNGIDATVEFDLPGGVVASTPWPVRAGPRFALGPGAFAYPGYTVVGRMPVERLDIGGAILEVVVVGPPVAAGSDAVRAWIRAAATGVASVHGGRFPRRRAQVVLLAHSGRGVVFGRAERGGAQVVLDVGRDSHAPDLATDWIAPNELFHLGLPHVPRRDAWFSEGVTTYDQSVVMARAGTLTPQAAWDELHDGFERGRASETGRSLEDDSSTMGATHAYWRVYWGGAAWALEADVALRRAGGLLDEVVRRWRDCCVDARVHDARDLIRRADAWFPQAQLGVGAAAALAATEFPSLRATYEALGLASAGASRVDVKEGGDVERLRRGITGPER